MSSSAVDPAQRCAAWDRALLALLQTGSPGAAQELLGLCRDMVRAQEAQPADQTASDFWRLASGFVEALSLDASALDLAAKRLLGRLRGQFVASANGAAVAPAAPLASQLLQACARHTVFLEQADAWSLLLEQAIADWLPSTDQPLPAAAGEAAHQLAARAQELGLSDLATLGTRLLPLLALAEQADAVVAMQADILADAVAHWRQLLHQLAAGVPKTVNPRVLAALADLHAAAAEAKSA